MQHILIDCEASIIQQTIWKLAGELWHKSEDTWPNISFRLILGVNLPNFTSTKNCRKKGCNRLSTILMLESVHLIWTLRCSWIIRDEGNLTKLPTEDKIHNKWVKTINMRFKFNKLQTDTKRYSSQAIRSDLVLKTWSGVLLNGENLPDNWIWESGVLVGITPCQPPGHWK
ncbi:hypothetical protein J3A83DRAFT_4084907 [Scleroderma citrinum]